MRGKYRRRGGHTRELHTIQSDVVLSWQRNRVQMRGQYRRRGDTMGTHTSSTRFRARAGCTKEKREDREARGPGSSRYVFTPLHSTALDHTPPPEKRRSEREASKTQRKIETETKRVQRDGKTKRQRERAQKRKGEIRS